MGFKAITLLDINGRTIFENRITVLPLKEEIIIRKSIEIYNDAEPCFIHRSAIMKRIYFEIDEFFTRAVEGGCLEVPWSDLPESISRAIDLQGRLFKVNTTTAK